MTIDDIRVVEENAHLKHFIFELVRCIDDGVPIANFFACADRNSGCCDEALLNAQQHIADALRKRVFFGGVAKCLFNIGDKVVRKDRPQTAYVVADFVNVSVSENTFALGVALLRIGEEGEQSDAMVYPASYINNNFIAESEA